MNTDKTTVMDSRTVASNEPSFLAQHLAGCVAMFLFKRGEISGTYPTEKVAAMIDKELTKLNIAI